MLSRRNLIAAAAGAAAALLGGRASFRAVDGAPPTSGYGALAALCSGLGCPEPIGKACLRALPAREASAAYLTRVIFAESASAGRDCTSARALRHSLRDQSRHDFEHGRTATVDGWLLSLTETRLYALAALLPPSPPGRSDNLQRVDLYQGQSG
jgi:hypothetical protein